MFSSNDVLNARITTGDWSEDGHNIHHAHTIEIPAHLKGKSEKGKEHKKKTWGCSSEPDLWFYYKLGVESGIPDLTALCSDYEDNKIDMGAAKAYVAAFGNDIFEDGFDETREGVYLTGEDYVRIWVDIVNKGIELNGEVGKVKVVTEEKSLNYNIGGYGLYSR